MSSKRDIVKAFKANDLVGSIARISNVSTLLGDSGLAPGFTRDGLIKNLADELRNCQQICSGIDLPVSALRIARMLTSMDGLRSKSVDFVSECASSIRVQVPITIEDELSLRSLFALPPSRSEYFDEPRNGFDEVIGRFPDAVMDVEEMRKCFALSRYAGCVFHSVQVIEHGLIEVGKWLPNLRDPKSGWTAVCNELSRIIKSERGKLSPFEREHFSFIEQLTGTIEPLKNAWRNKISHAQGRLVVLSPDFAPEIAEEIMLATRGFMRRLANDLPLGGV
jgi:hypothetical protein